MNLFKKSNRKKIQILFKSGNSITLTVDLFSVEKSTIDNTIIKLSWGNMDPRLMYICLDNISHFGVIICLIFVWMKY